MTTIAYKNWLEDRIKYFEEIVNVFPTLKRDIQFMTALKVYQQCYKMLTEEN